MKLIAEYKFAARPGRSQGAVILRENKPGERMRFVTHWRNDEFDGTGQGNYLPDLAAGLDDFDARVVKEMAERTAADPALAPKGPFSVGLWGSPREEDNDDHWVGDTYPTFELALSEFRRLTAEFRRADWRHAYLDAADGPLIHQVNPAPPRRSADDDLDRSEAANLAGMAHGTAGRNEALGEEVEEPPAYGRR